MEREAAWLMGKPGWENFVLYMQSDTAAYGGHFAQARELTWRAVGSAQRADRKETAAAYDAEAALREALVGNLSAAKQQAGAALALSKNTDVEGLSAVALGLAGDPSQAWLLADEIGKAFPKGTVVQRSFLPTIGAAAVIRHDPRKAISLLAVSAPYELGQATVVSFCLYGVYLRGEAYLATNQGSAAAAEFQGFSITPAWLRTNRSAHWRIWDWDGPTFLWKIRAKANQLTRTSSRSGKTLTRTFPSSKRPRQSMPNSPHKRAKSTVDLNSQRSIGTPKKTLPTRLLELRRGRN
jgi:hypothetical protein